MKKYLKFLPVYLFAFCLIAVSCSSEEAPIVEENSSDSFLKSNPEIKVDYVAIDNMISVFDSTLNFIENNPESSEAQRDEYFTDLLSKGDSFPVANIENREVSDVFYSIDEQIGQASKFETKENYMKDLQRLRDLSIDAEIEVIEKEVLVNKIECMISFTNWAEQRIGGNGNAQTTTNGWWDTTKCVLGTVGMAGGGALAGATVGGVGCTVVLPIIGTVACGTVGAVAGGLFGAMVGVASFC